ncbi:MAG TPA: hypothetical protein VI357_00670 [Mycobacteriales bacterium]
MAASTYVPTPVLRPPMSELAASARQARISSPLRLHRSASTPEGTSKIGTTAAYAAAISPMEAASKPIPVWNSFSTGTQSMKPCRPMPTWSGRRRRASRGSMDASVIGNDP